MARFSPDRDDAPRLSPAQRNRLDKMTDAQITMAAGDDPDNGPLREDELGKLRSARMVRQARQHTGLSQAAFARTYRINVARLRDLEQGRTQADSALLAYLTVIAKDPDTVRRAFSE
jgi:putative transcriptional regulator